jgi:hypothetical protein
MTIGRRLDEDGKELPSYCDLDTNGGENHWVDGGICMLDTMNKAQIVYSIEHNPKARADLPKVTSHPELLELLVHVPLLSTEDEDQETMDRLQSGSPFYDLFRGNLSNS